MALKDLVTHETAARAYAKPGHGDQQAGAKAKYISATSWEHSIDRLQTAVGTFIGAALVQC
ncbi:hypothetical protein [Roseobacter sp.]|uniref:hypothetical protein n=1 Tax=Roseobacter sp. TaxID=1907202 RepID=UPI00385F5F19